MTGEDSTENVSQPDWRERILAYVAVGAGVLALGGDGELAMRAFVATLAFITGFLIYTKPVIERWADQRRASR